MRASAFLSLTVIFLVFCASAEISVTLPQENSAITNTVPYATFSNTETFGLPGEPELPVYYATILLPPDADLGTVKVSVMESDEAVVRGMYRIKPVPPYVTSDGLVSFEGKRNIQDGKDIAVYSTDAFFPKKYIRYVQTAQLRDYKLVDVAVQLYKYNPVSGALKRLRAGTLTVDYLQSATRSVLDHGVPENALNIVRDKAVNYDAMADQYSGLRILPRAGYCIITTSSIQSSSAVLSQFVNTKKSEGYAVEVLTEPAWGGGTGDAAMNNIRNWLKANYVQKAIDYVFIIGSAAQSSQVPMTLGTTASDKTPLVDYCYADLTGETWNPAKNRYYEYADEGVCQNTFDKYAEVNVGRLPVYGNSADIDYLLNKIIRYVTEPKATAETWRFNIIMPLHTFGDAQNGWAFGEYIKTNILTPNAWKWFRVYDDHMGLGAEGYPCSYENVKKYWNGGKFGAMIWQGHGAVTYTDQVMSTATAAGLTDAFPSHGFQVSCNNGKPDDPTNLGYAIFRYAAISTIASAVQLWYNQNTTNYGTRTGGNDFGYVYLKHLIGSKLPAAAAFNKGRSEIPASATSDWQNLTELNLYGCPAVGAYTYGVTTAIQPVAEKSRKEFFNLSPAPGKKICITVRNGTDFKSAHVSIYSVQGRLIARHFFGSQDAPFVCDLKTFHGSGVSGGIYTVAVELTGNDGGISSGRTRLLIQ